MTTTVPPAATIVVTADDTGTLADIERRATAADRTILIDVRVGNRNRFDRVAEAILDGLGKDPNVTSMRRTAQHLAAGWLSLGEHDDAVVADAGQLSDPLLIETVDFLRSFGIRPWLMFAVGTEDDPEDTQERIDTLADAVHATVEDRARYDTLFTTATPAQSTREGRGAAMPVRLTLPRVDGCLFRTFVHERFRADDANEIDAKLRDHVTDLDAVLVSIDGQMKSRQFAGHLRNRMHDTGDTEELHLLVRAAQIAGLRRGWHVTVDPIMFFGAEAALPRRGKAETFDWWNQLDRYADPDVGAVAALYLAGVDCGAIPDINVGDITPGDDGSVTVQTTAGVVTIEACHGARFLTALRAWRLDSGAGEHDAALVTHRTDVGISSRLPPRILATAAEVGAVVAKAPIRKKHPDPVTWLKSYGIEISKLTYSKDRKYRT